MLMSKSDWEINIENAANAAAAEYGSSTVKSVFARYDAHGFYDLYAKELYNKNYR